MIGSRSRHRAGRRPRSLYFHPEALEGRVVPATLTIMNAADAGPGSLRAAIAQAQSGDTIDFAPQLDGQTITLTSGELAISTSLDIEGPGASQLTVSGGGSSRVFDITSPSATVTLAGLTIADGRAPESTGDGGGISNAGTLMVTACTLSGNSAVGTSTSFGDGANGSGGGVNNTGTLTITDSTLAGNSAHGGSLVPNPDFSNAPGDGGSGSGGGVNNTGTLTITHSTLAGNSAIGGSGFNGGSGSGGGVNNTGTLTITDSTFSGNAANGGGSQQLGLSLLRGRGGDGSGGAVFNAGVLTITYSTLADNSASGGSGGFMSTRDGVGYGGGVNNTSMLTITDSILAGNSASSGPDLSGGLTSSGHNLIGNASGGSGFAPSDLLNVNPLLAPLANYGGPTLTYALLPGSPAIDAASSVGALATDQRGVPRPQGAGFDIGAFELQAALTPTTTTLSPPSATITTTQSVQFTAVVAPTSGTGTPAGDVVFTLDNTPLPPVPLQVINGVDEAILPLSGLSAGQHTLLAAYQGNPTFAPSPPSNTATIDVSAVTAPPTAVALQRFGFHLQPTILVLSFSEALDPARAQNVNNYQIVTLGGPGRGGNLVGHRIGVFRAVYLPATAQVELFPGERLDLHNLYQLTVVGTPPGGLTSADGVPLDGRGNGIPGSNHVALVTGSLLAGPASAAPTPDPIRLVSRAPAVHAPVPSGPLGVAGHSVLRHRGWVGR